jgi:aminoglycoside phosphotransferase (APT) family kinase protein
VPRVFALCPDPDLIGAPFYVMEHVQGRVLRNVEQVANLDVAEAGRCSTALGDVLVALHSVDYEARGLGDFGRPEGFLARNVSRWNKQWDANRTRTMPAVDEIGRRLKQAVPESGPPAVIHGDYRLDNTMLALEDAGRVVAVLDWEMSTIGDPLTDLGLLAVYWGDVLPPDAIGVPLSHVPGFGSTDAMVERYAEASGRAVDELEFYIVLALYKLAVILEGINKRFQMGQTVGGGFDGLGDVVSILGDIALERASSAPNHRLRG